MATITVDEMKDLARLAKEDMMIHFMFRLQGLGVETVGRHEEDELRALRAKSDH